MRTSARQAARVYAASVQWVILGMVLLLTVLLGGCAFLQAVSFQRHELSLVPPDEVTVELVSKQAEGGVRGQMPRKNAVMEPLDPQASAPPAPRGH